MAVSSNTNASAGETTPSHTLLVFAAKDASSVEQTAAKVSSYAEAHPDSLGDIAHTLAQAASKTTQPSHRAFAVVERQSPSLPIEVSPTVKAPNRRPEVHFIFTGQGAQWAGMGAELLTSYPSFRADIKEMDKVLQQLPHPPLWTIEDELSRSPEKSRIQQPELSLPVTTALQIGLVNILRSSFELRPDAVLGHSTGEIAAAYASGALSLSAAITIAYYSGQAAQHLAGEGAMAAVGLGRGDAETYLDGEDGIVVACENSPQNVTLSGDKAALEGVLAKIKADHPDRVARLLRVERAFHSQHIKDIGDELENLLQQGLDSVTEGQGKVPAVSFFSTVTASKVEGKGKLGAGYWRGNLEVPVRFQEAARLLLRSTASRDGSILLEVGPHSALSQPLEEILAEEEGAKAQYVATVVRGQSVVKSLLSSVGQLYQQNASVNLSPSVAGGKPVDELVS